MQAWRQAIEAVLARSRSGAIEAVGVDVHFHPDAVIADGGTVLDALAADRRWRTQFSTGTSNGGLTAHRGGDRWRWESRLFAGAYDDVPVEERPVYGGLRLGDDPYGSAPRFGSAYLWLRAAALERTTLCYPDSAWEPEAVGTPMQAGAVIQAMQVPMVDPLDRYVEAHMHGGLHLDDVAALVLDPSFRGTAVEAAAGRSGLGVRWHPGYRLVVDRAAELAEYRGAPVARVAAATAVDGVLTPAILGAARAAGAADPQTLKRVWHLLARFGRRDAEPGPALTR